MLKYNDKEVIIINSYTNKSIVLDTKTLKTELVDNNKIKIVK
jgi:hypothetical protein